ncbi:hypothetical protein L6R52_14815 [Myxococcota bacterium]|nr:hypothetical protein [Myxococcota bacterium]
MSLVLGLVGAATAVSVAIAGQVYAARRQNDAWGAAARQLGLSLIPAKAFVQRPFLSGVIRGHSVVVEVATIGHGKSRREVTRFRVDAQGKVPRTLQLAKQGLVETITATLGSGDETVGDPAFDGAVAIRGDRPIVLAALGARARAAYLELRRTADVTVVAGALTCQLAGATSGPRVTALVEGLVELAELLAVDPARLEDALVRNLETERVPTVRLALFRAITGGHASDAVAERTIERALRHPDPALRLEAATLAGHRGHVIFAILAKNAEVADELRARAIERLAEEAGEGHVDPVELLSLGGGPLALVAAAEWVRELEPAGAEPALVPLLSHDATPVRIAAAEALARVGTIAAVEALGTAERGLFVDRDLKRAARGAIHQIQARAGAHAGAGQLSIAAPAEEGGALSVVARTEGALSVAKTGEAGGLGVVRGDGADDER